MAELKPIKITVDGVDKAVKSVEQLQRELQEVRSELNKIKEAGENAGKSLTNIDKGVRFANLRAAFKEVRAAVVQSVADSVSGGKTMTETVNSVGQSVAGIASSFGLVGVAVGTAVTLMTPFIASLFEASEATKLLDESTKSLDAELATNSATLDTYYNVIKDGTASETDLKNAKDKLINQFPEYFKNIDTEKLTKEQLLLIESDLRRSSELMIKQKAKEGLSIKILTKVYEKELELKKILARDSKIAAISLEDLKEASLSAAFGVFGLGTQIATFETDADRATREIKELRDELNGLNNDTTGVGNAFTKAGNAISNALKKTLPQAEKSGTSTKKAATDFQQYGETVDEVLKEIDQNIKDGSISNKSIAEGFNQLDIATQKYLTTFDAYAKGASEAGERIDELNAKNKELIATQAEADKALTDTQGNLQREVERSFNLLRELNTIGDDKVSIVNKADPNVPYTQESLDEFKIVAQQILKTTKDTDKALALIQAEAAKRGIAFGRIEAKQAIISEQQEILKTTKSELDKNGKEIASLQAKLEKVSGEELNKERQRILKEREKLNKEFLDRQQRQIDAAIKAEEAGADEAAKARLQANKAQLDELTGQIDRAAQAKITDVTERINPTLQGINDLIGKQLFSFADDIPEVNEEILRLILNSGELSSEQANAVLSAVKVAEDGIDQIRAVNVVKQQEIINANLKFVESYIANYKTLNENELREARVFLERRTLLEKEAQREAFDNAEDVVKNRRSQQQTQSDEELAFIKQSREDALAFLKSDQQARYALQFDADEQALKLAQLNGADTALIEQELYNKRRELQIQFNRERLDTEKKFDTLIDKERDKTNQQIVKEGVAIVQQAQIFGNLLVDLFNQNSQNIIDGLNEQLDSVEQRTSDALSRIAALEDDLEGKRSGRRDAVLQALEQQREIERQLAEDKIRLQQKIEQEERKIRKREQAAAIANALINGAIAQTNIWATVPKADFGVSTFVLSGIAAGITAAQVGLIASQKFAEGGFTGDGTITDNTGHKVAGVVHNDEWVAPKWMTESPKFSPIIQQLENARTRGFANGGFTSPDYNGLSNAVNPNNTANMERMMQQYMQSAIELSNRPIYTKATEVQSVAQRNNRRRTATTI